MCKQKICTEEVRHDHFSPHKIVANRKAMIIPYQITRNPQWSEPNLNKCFEELELRFKLLTLILESINISFSLANGASNDAKRNNKVLTDAFEKEVASLPWKRSETTCDVIWYWL